MLIALCATVLWQLGHNFLKWYLKVTVLLHYRKAVIISKAILQIQEVQR